MKKFLRYILVAAISSCIIPFSSCSDDDENAVNEWNMTYVSLLPTNYLKPLTTEFNLTHAEGTGIEGVIDFQFMATASKVVEQDVTVDIELTTTLPISADKIVLSSQQAIIKAGQKQSEPISLSITDWSDLVDVKEAAEYTLNIKMKSINTNVEGVTYSDFNKEFAFTVKKAAEKPKQEVLVTTPEEWIFTFMDGVENQNSNSVMTNVGNTDVATNGIPFWLTVDFKSVKTVTGIQTQHWGAPYAPTKVELFTSENGTTWISIGVFDTSGANQIIKFENRIDTRYLKYQMIDVPGRVDILRFYVYMYQ